MGNWIKRSMNNFGFRVFGSTSDKKRYCCKLSSDRH